MSPNSPAMCRVTRFSPPATSSRRGGEQIAAPTVAAETRLDGVIALLAKERRPLRSGDGDGKRIGRITPEGVLDALAQGEA